MGGGKGWDQQIARRLIVLIVMASGVLALLATIAQLWLEYERDVARINEGFPQIEASYLSSVEQNVWLVDEQRLSLLLEGITQLPDFRYAVVWDETGMVVAEAGEPGGITPLTRSWPLSHDHRGTPLRIGTLEVAADLEGVYQRLWERVGVILLMNFLKTALVALFILVMVRRLVTRPLEHMAAYARRLTPDRLEEPLVLPRARDTKGSDELDYLAASLNAMREDLKASYGRVRASEVRFRGLFANTPVALWELDVSDVKRALDGLPCRSVEDLTAWWQSNPRALRAAGRGLRVLAVNQATLDLYGARNRSVLVRALAAVLGTEGDVAFQALLRSLWLGRLSDSCEAEVLALDGEVKRVVARWSVLPGAERTFSRVIVSLLDVTEAAHAREDLQRTVTELARSNSELERFAYVASHDLREPLRSIVSYSQLLERRAGGLDAEAYDFLGYIVRGAKRMDDLVGDLLSYSRITQRLAPFVSINLSVAVDAVIDGLGPAIREAGATVEIGSLPRVVANRVQIMEVFQNLIVNAIKYRRPGIPLRIEIGGATTGEGWRLFVRDNGMGIDPVHHEAVFEVFRRLHGPEEYGGTGMGLAICRRIMRFHEGAIWVESSPGSGSTFYMTLPRHRPSESETGDAPVAAEEPREAAPADRGAESKTAKAAPVDG